MLHISVPIFLYLIICVLCLKTRGLLSLELETHPLGRIFRKSKGEECIIGFLNIQCDCSQKDTRVCALDCQVLYASKNERIKKKQHGVVKLGA